MVLPINPLEVIKIFTERGIRNREAMVGYLLTIARVATDLANCWDRILECCLMTDEAEWEEKRPDRNLMRAMNIQRSLFCEASEYYTHASSVLRSRLSKAEMDDLFSALGGLLNIREETKMLFEMNSEDDDPLGEYLAGRTYRPNLPTGIASHICLPGGRAEELQRKIDEMQREAAILRAMAAAVRAQP